MITKQMTANDLCRIYEEEKGSSPVNLYKGYTEAELREAFEQIQDKEDWKNPIKAVIKSYEFSKFEAAVEFFTSSQLEIVERGVNQFRVYASGYYNACASGAYS